jgi:uncharacterized protein
MSHGSPSQPSPFHDSAPPSPCNQRCKLDSAQAMCVGCFRTIEEIEAWPRATNAQKKMILELVAARRGGQ